MKLLAGICLVSMSMASARFTIAAEMPGDDVNGAIALNSGKHFTVEFHADPCVACRVFAPLVRETVPSPEFMGITLLVANFDTGKLLQRPPEINKQDPTVVDENAKRNTPTDHAPGNDLGNAPKVPAGSP